MNFETTIREPKNVPFKIEQVLTNRAKTILCLLCNIVQKSKSVLVMDNAFISPEGELDVEEISNEIFNELYWRSLLLNIEKADFVLHWVIC